MPPRSRKGTKSRSASPAPRTPGRTKKSPVTPRTKTPVTNKNRSYEWGGPLGALGMVVLLPLTVIGLNVLCSETSCSVHNVWDLPAMMLLALDVGVPRLLLALGVELLWMAFHALLYITPVGKQVKGVKLSDGTCLTYNINALHVFTLVHAILGSMHYADVIRLAWLADMFMPLMVAAIIISVFMSIVLYVASFRSSQVSFSPGGNTGNYLYDFWVGRELNPRTGSLDWKFMCELRPGLIGWSVLNWAFVAKAMEVGTCSPSIIVVALLESFYVLDGLLYEEGNLTMMDIVHDGFGFMLCFGDLAWVPFTYTLKAKFLAYHASQLSYMHVGICAAVALVGYAVFRGSNNQKSRFRQNPKDPANAALKVMHTSSGKSLIVSGYWGVCRHPNYVGDWLMTLSWSALTGFTEPLPYFQPVYFALLLIHRQLRDEEQMREKYGAEDMHKFHRIVRYRLIPYVY
ncbi:C-14 sterol reductase, putative [Trypanosoma equiperdum]|uniref:Delta(14)-sterol reductase ERG24 n=1 Tax=Trypanosoma equiperdum TaxID=5694 RepID=A0A1G4I0X6_TRYEQ|nr:C-14 sterol reductase, putative [Trypanosoma equiperdum]